MTASQTKRSQHRLKDQQSVGLTLIEVVEIAPSDELEPLRWRLLTTHEAAAAWRIVDGTRNSN